MIRSLIEIMRIRSKASSLASILPDENETFWYGGEGGFVEGRVPFVISTRVPKRSFYALLSRGIGKKRIFNESLVIPGTKTYFFKHAS